APHRQVTGDLTGVEYVKRSTPIESEVVGDVHQRIDGTQPDRQEPLLQPFRRGTVPDAAHVPERKAGAQVRRLDRHPDRTFTLALDRLHGLRPEPSQPARRKIAGNAI